MKNRKKHRKQQISQLIIGGVIGLVFGLLLIYAEILGIPIYLTTLFLILFFIIQIAIHELGHLIGGLLSGYQFLSYRLFSLIILSNEGRLKVVRQKVPGTLGQCLMIPPEEEEAFKFKLYLAGGVLMNLFLSFISLIFIGLYPVFVMEFALIGLFFALVNGIPFGFNDGNTYRIVNASKKYEIILYRQLEINAKMIKGARFSDFPASYFYSEPNKDKQLNYFDDFQSFLQLGLALENKNWHELQSILDELWLRKEDLILPYQLELKKEMLSFLLINHPLDNRIDQLISDKQLRNYLKMTVISNYRVNAIVEFCYYAHPEEALELITKGFTLKEKTSNLGDYLIEEDLLMMIKLMIENQSDKNITR